MMTRALMLSLVMAGAAVFGCSSTDLVKQCQNDTCSDGKTMYKLCASTSGVVVHDEFFDAAGNSQHVCTSSDADYQQCIINATKSGNGVCP
jgi:hypothetical protein